MALTQYETYLVAEFLTDYSGHLRDDSCDSYDLDDTPANRALVRAAMRRDEMEDTQLMISGGKIHTTNWLIIDELRYRLLHQD